MKKVFFIIIFFLFFLQTSFFPALLGGGFFLNLLLSATVSLVLLFGFETSLMWIFLIGVLFEAFSSEIFGFGMLSFLIVGIFVFLAKSIFLSDERRQGINCLIFTLSKILFDLSFFVTNRFSSFFFKNNNDFFIDFFTWRYLMELAFFVIISIVLYWVFSKIRGFDDKNLKEIKI